MSRKGYAAELEAKKLLCEAFGDCNVIKMAIGQAADYIVLTPFENKVQKFVEIKHCHDSKYYPSPKEKDQFMRILNLAMEHNTHAEIWIRYPNKPWDKRILTLANGKIALHPIIK